MIEPASPRDEPARITARDPWRAHYDLLAAMGAGDFAHVAGTLAPHLANTASLLQQWGNRDALCVAGLYHAVYGTAGIRGELATLARRSAIAEVVGVEAEAIVFVYAACDRDAFHPRIGTPRETRFVDRFTATEYTIPVAMLADFCELTLAYELELARRSAAFLAKHRLELAALADRMRPHVSDAALHACRTMLSAF